jgi:hypothetical protein
MAIMKPPTEQMRMGIAPSTHGLHHPASSWTIWVKTEFPHEVELHELARER